MVGLLNLRRTVMPACRGGFTLVELLIVVAIITILVAISVPAFIGAVDGAKLSTDKANYRDAKAAAANIAFSAQIDGVTIEMGTDSAYYYDTKSGSVLANGIKPEGYGRSSISYDFEHNVEASEENGGVIAEGKVLKLEFFEDDPLPKIYWVE